MNRALDLNAAAEQVENDRVWLCLRAEVEAKLKAEPLLGEFMNPLVIEQDSFAQALSALLAQKLECPALTQPGLRQLCLEAYQKNPDLVVFARHDLDAICERDPACDEYSLPFLYYKGFHGIQMYRIGHWLWQNQRIELARYLQSRVSETFAMDIHPAAQLGSGILIDHATSLVIGETAVVGDNVSMLHEVTLGGTGKESGDRHPKISSGVLIGAGAKILGNVRVGRGAKVGAGSVVLDDVEAHCTVAGVPAKPVGHCGSEQPAREMNHTL